MSWLKAGELTSAALKCVQLQDDKVVVLGSVVYPSIIIPPPPPRAPKKKSDTVRKVLIGVLCGVGGLLIIAGIVAFILTKKVRSNENSTNCNIPDLRSPIVSFDLDQSW